MAGREAQVCGESCRIAVKTISDARLDAWYDLRTHADARGATTADPDHRAELNAWCVPEVEASLLRHGRNRRDDGGDRARAATESAFDATAVTLSVEGMRCAGCAWLVERLLASVRGVSTATVNFPLRRAEVHFDTRATRLHTLLETLAKAGYRATPYTVHAEEAAIESERRERIRNLGISGLFGMQVMLLSIAIYASDWYGGMDVGFEQLFRWLAMTLTVPVLAWPGRTFFTGAIAALRGRSLTMDVPVALGLSIAFVGSVHATITGEGEVWFDSVVMFVTLLSAARYLELLARRRATATIRAFARSAPLVATRVRSGETDGDTASQAGCDTACQGGDRGAGNTAGGGRIGDDPGVEPIPAAALRPGDRVRVRPGEVVPADGTIRTGHSAFDESLLTGESNPVTRSAGGQVLAGSVNGAGVVEFEVTGAGDATVLGGVLRRSEQAARERPAIAQLADRAAAWFIGGVLVLAAGVAIGWLAHDQSRMIPVLVSVLVVTCPCALSLATPAAMAAALGALARAGLIATRANAVERLALATHCLADKTGTLTEGRFRVQSVTTFTGVSELRCLALAAALERFATHPAASAFVAAADEAASEAGGEPGVIGPVQEPTTRTGGVEGLIDGVRYAVGSPEFVARVCGVGPGNGGGHASGRVTGNEALVSSPRDAPPTSPDPVAAGTAASGTEAPGPGEPGRILRRRVDNDTNANEDTDTSASEDGDTNASDAGDVGDGATRVLLAREGVLLASFSLADTLRSDAGQLIDGLRARGIETTIASGDSPAAVERAARVLGVARYLSRLSPEDKLDEAARLAASRERVLMLGDGVNDTPALAGAHVSVAMGRGAAAAAARADAVLIGDGPGRLLAALDIARFAHRIVKQNLAWALGYNLVALPLAAAGMVPPWAAAVGMSLSSLAVAGNALRLGRGRDTARG